MAFLGEFLMSLLQGLFKPNIETLKKNRDIDGLIKALRYYQKDYKVRMSAVYALEEIGDIRAFEPLVDTLKDSNEEVRRRVMYALARIGGTRAVEPLAAALDDSDGIVRRFAIQALAEIGNTRAVELLIMKLENHGWEQNDIIQALVKIKDTRAVEPLMNVLQDDSLYWETRALAAEALGKIKDARAVEPLINALKDNYPLGIREHAAKALGEIQDKRAVEPLLVVLNVISDAEEALMKIEPNLLELFQWRLPGLIGGGDWLNVFGENPEWFDKGVRQALEEFIIQEENFLEILNYASMRYYPSHIYRGDKYDVEVSNINKVVPIMKDRYKSWKATKSKNPYYDQALQGDDHAVDVLTYVEDFSLLPVLKKKQEQFDELCASEDTSHGGTTYWQIYGYFIEAVKRMIRKAAM